MTTTTATVTAPIHAQRTLPSSPPPYVSPTRARSISPVPVPVELHLDTTPSPPRSNRTSWAGTESDITSASHSGIMSPNAGLVDISLISPAAGSTVIKSPAQRLKNDPIAALLYLRKVVTVTTAEKEKSVQSARRNSSASESSMVVGEEEKIKECDVAEQWTVAPRASDRRKLSASRQRDIEAQRGTEQLARYAKFDIPCWLELTQKRSRRPMMIAAIIFLALIILAGITLGIYLGVRNGFD